jgi:hypothetical protein
MVKRITLLSIVFILGLLFSCKKDKPSKPPITLPNPVNQIYADSVFYIQNSNDYFVSPVITQQGNFTSFPSGLNIDQNTGIINVNKSETGLKYQVSFTPSGSSDIQISYIIISGINYSDKIYNLSLGDSVAVPIYNANRNLTFPSNNNAFDESGGCKNAGIMVDPSNAVINLAQSVRSQAIDTGSTAQVKLVYKLNDNSNGAPNGLDIKIYFYKTASQIPQYLTDLLNERKGTILTSASVPPGLNHSSLNALSTIALKATNPPRPRPPCIIVVSQ